MKPTIAFDRLGEGTPVILVLGAFNTRDDRRAAGRGARRPAHRHQLRPPRPRRQRRLARPMRSSARSRISTGLIQRGRRQPRRCSDSRRARRSRSRQRRMACAITRLALFDLPLPAGRPANPVDHAAALDALVRAGRRGDAVEYFQRRMVGIPEPVIAAAAHARRSARRSRRWRTRWSTRPRSSATAGCSLDKARKVRAPTLAIAAGKARRSCARPPRRWRARCPTAARSCSRTRLTISYPRYSRRRCSTSFASIGHGPPHLSAVRSCCGLEIGVTDGKVTSIRGHEADVLQPRLHLPEGRRAARPARGSGSAARAARQARRRSSRRRGTRRSPRSSAGCRRSSRAHGRDAVAMSIGNPAAHKLGLLLYGARLGTRARHEEHLLGVDARPDAEAARGGLMFGHWLVDPGARHRAHASCSSCSARTRACRTAACGPCPTSAARRRRCRRAAAGSIVIDPRRTETAAIADQHLFIRPGSDVFLLLGIVHVLFAERLVRLGRLAAHVEGVEARRAARRRVLARARGGALRDRAAAIRELARAIARTERAARVRPHRHVHAGVRHARELARRRRSTC